MQSPRGEERQRLDNIIYFTLAVLCLCPLIWPEDNTVGCYSFDGEALGHCGNIQRNIYPPLQGQDTKIMGESGISAEGRGTSESQAAVVALKRLFQMIEVHMQSLEQERT